MKTQPATNGSRHTGGQPGARHGLLVGLVLLGGGCLLWGCSSLSFGSTQVRPTQVTEINDETEFTRAVLQAPGPVIAIFHSPGCGTCHKVLKSLPGLAESYAGRVTFATVDTAVSPKLGGAYGARWVPLWVFFDRGQERKRISGWRPSFWTRDAIDDFLAGK